MYYRYKCDPPANWIRISRHKFWNDPQLKIDKLIGEIEIKYESSSPAQQAHQRRFIELGQLHSLYVNLYNYAEKYRLSPIHSEEKVAISRALTMIKSRIHELHTDRSSTSRTKLTSQSISRLREDGKESET